MPGTDGFRFVKARRQQLGISRRRAAERAGLTQQAWTEIELGYRKASDATLAKMDEVLNVRPGLLKSLEVEVKGPEFAAIRQETMDALEQLTTREHVDQTVRDAIRARAEFLLHRLDELEAEYRHRHRRDR